MTAIRDILRTMEYGPAPEASDGVHAWLERHAAGLTHFIDGGFVSLAERELFDVWDPSRATLLARVTQGTAADIDAAVTAARRAHSGWSALSGHARARYLYALARHVQKHERFFAVLESLDTGKPIRESRDIDVPLVVRHFYHHAGWAELVATEFPDRTSIGVCGQIIPWNFPLLMLAWKIAPALAAGNTVVLKPAEFTPLTALAFAEVCRDIGLPPGVVNIVCGDGNMGAALVAHPGVDKIAFTGSTAVGRAIRIATAGSRKRLCLELGGKSPFIVYDDADLDAAVEGVVDAVWFNGGQVCCAGSRLIVQEGIADRFHAKLKTRMEHLRVGDPLDKSTDIGAIVAPVQLARIGELVETGRREGAMVWSPAHALPATGWFFPPTLITEAAPASTVAEVEIFGPVAVSLTFRTPDEAIALANNTRYGLAASIWSENISLALDAAAGVQAGVVWINATNLFDAAAGFGGYKESGFGREGGREGIAEYLAPRPSRGDAFGASAAVPTTASNFAAGPGGAAPVVPTAAAAHGHAYETIPAIDRTAKLYIGGKQTRPDGGVSYAVRDAAGNVIGYAGAGNRKDLRNAVEAAAKASAWSDVTAHNRAQVLYYLAENLTARGAEFAARLTASTGVDAAGAQAEVQIAIERIFWYAAWADKYDGRVHATKSRHVTLALHEPWGVMGIACPDEAPLLGLVSLVIPAIAMGNRVVAIPSSPHPLVAVDLYSVLDTSDVPDGVVNFVTGDRDVLARVLAEHHDVAAVWYFGSASGSAVVEAASAANLKATWVNGGSRIAWESCDAGQGRRYLTAATQVKNIWIPYGV